MKSTGMLLDEYITAGLKYEADRSEENKARLEALKESFQLPEGNKELDHLVKRLNTVLRECWFAQEVLGRAMKFPKRYLCKQIIKEAFIAQRRNATRNELIREIDAILGQSEITPLQKTYK